MDIHVYIYGQVKHEFELEMTVQLKRVNNVLLLFHFAQ